MGQRLLMTLFFRLNLDPLFITHRWWCKPLPFKAQKHKSQEDEANEEREDRSSRFSYSQKLQNKTSKFNVKAINFNFSKSVHETCVFQKVSRLSRTDLFEAKTVAHQHTERFISFIWACEIPSDCITHIKCTLRLRWIEEDRIDDGERDRIAVCWEWNWILLPVGSKERNSTLQINQRLNARRMMLCLILREKAQIYSSHYECLINVWIEGVISKHTAPGGKLDGRLLYVCLFTVSWNMKSIRSI